MRLFRLPRLIKLIDVSKFQKVVNSLTSEEGSRDDKIIAEYKMLYVYKVVRLIMIAIILTYFIGCFWFLFCSIYGDLDG